MDSRASSMTDAEIIEHQDKEIQDLTLKLKKSNNVAADYRGQNETLVEQLKGFIDAQPQQNELTWANRVAQCLQDSTWKDDMCDLSKEMCHPEYCPKLYYEAKGIDWRAQYGRAGNPGSPGPLEDSRATEAGTPGGSEGDPELP